jgi:hypothetical protein
MSGGCTWCTNMTYLGDNAALRRRNIHALGRPRREHRPRTMYALGHVVHSTRRPQAVGHRTPMQIKQAEEHGGPAQQQCPARPRRDRHVRGCAFVQNTFLHRGSETSDAWIRVVVCALVEKRSSLQVLMISDNPGSRMISAECSHHSFVAAWWCVHNAELEAFSIVV